MATHGNSVANAPLTPAQQHIVERLRSGWGMGRVLTLTSHYWLQQGGLGRGGITESVHASSPGLKPGVSRREPMKKYLLLTLETNIAEDSKSDCSVTVDTIVDIGVDGERGYVGTVLAVTEINIMDECMSRAPADRSSTP